MLREIGRRMRVEDRYDKWANTVSGSNIFLTWKTDIRFRIDRD
jgi:hypothetical protein